MQTKQFTRSIISLGLALLLAGCGGNRESKLIGSWKARPMSAILNGIKGNANGASTQQAVDAAKIMAAATLDVRADKTFTINLSAPIEGTWTWSEDTGIMSLTPSKTNGQAAPSPASGTTAKPAFKAKLSDDDSMLSVSDSLPSADGNIELNFEKS